jgi:hypothetical protein
MVQVYVTALHHSRLSTPANTLRRARRSGSDADADLAEQRFKKRLSDYRGGHAAPPEAWRVPGKCLAEVLGLWGQGLGR